MKTILAFCFIFICVPKLIVGAIPFHVGEVWRGRTSSCSTSIQHVMDLTVDNVEGNHVFVTFNQRDTGLTMEM